MTFKAPTAETYKNRMTSYGKQFLLTYAYILMQDNKKIGTICVKKRRAFIQINGTKIVERNEPGSGFNFAQSAIESALLQWVREFPDNPLNLTEQEVIDNKSGWSALLAEKNIVVLSAI